MLRETIKSFINNVFLPRWMVFFADMLVIGFVFMFTWLLRYNLEASAVDLPKMLVQLAVILPIFAFSEYIFKPYQGILRHSSVLDALDVIKSHTLGTSGMVLVTLAGRAWQPVLVIPWSVLISQFFISVSLLVGFRFLVAFVYHRLIRQQVPGIPVMIFGAGVTGMMTKGVLEKDFTLPYHLVGFIDDNPMLYHKKVEGVMVYPPEVAFGKIVDEKEIREVIICISPEKISKERKSVFVDQCIDKNLRVKEIPETKEWLNGRFFASQIHDVQIEDLLGRDTIVLDDNVIRKGIHGKKIMVTGAAGSIGSEMVRQLSLHFPSALLLVDQAESPLYNLFHEIARENRDMEIRTFVADVTDQFRMEKIFSEESPELVFHASAYKHVPMMEDQPYEAIRTNILGTVTVADLSVKYGVKRFVMVSTDKAVNPTNVMGATKRICELYTQSLNHLSGRGTRFITTRFGNVLGSSGSVIPLFRTQISRGGPVTVTHRDIFRYFMTIPEACRLVLEAGFMGKGGEIFIFDMGKPVRIYDLAEKMIRLSGFIPHKDIPIIETGLRPGEKLYEELLSRTEETLPTHHEKIMVAKTREFVPQEIVMKIKNLLTRLTRETENELVSLMKDIVPEYVSRNSRFEALDGEND